MLREVQEMSDMSRPDRGAYACIRCVDLQISIMKNIFLACLVFIFSDEASIAYIYVTNLHRKIRFVFQ